MSGFKVEEADQLVRHTRTPPLKITVRQTELERAVKTPESFGVTAANNSSSFERDSATHNSGLMQDALDPESQLKRKTNKVKAVVFHKVHKT